MDSTLQISGGEKLPVASKGGGCGGGREIVDCGFGLKGLAGKNGDAGGMRGGEIVRVNRRKCNRIYWESEGFCGCSFDIFGNFE